MGQQEIYKFLKDHRGSRFTARQIATGTGMKPEGVCTSMRGLISTGLVSKLYILGEKPRREMKAFYID